MKQEDIPDVEVKARVGDLGLVVVVCRELSGQSSRWTFLVVRNISLQTFFCYRE